MNISAAASAVGVSPATLREWDERIPSLNIPRDRSGRRRFQDEHLGLLQTVKRLSEQGRSFESIAVLVEPAAPSILTAAPVQVRPGERDWLQAALLAAQESAFRRSLAMEEAIQELNACRNAIEKLQQRNSELIDANAKLAREKEIILDRLERAELMKAVRQEEKPWWKFW